MLSFLTKYLWQGASLALAVGLLGSTLKGCSLEKDLLKEQREVSRLGQVLSDERTASAVKLGKAKDDAREAEQFLQKEADNTRKELNDSIDDLRTQRDGLSQRLRIAEGRAKALGDSLYGLSSTTEAPRLGQAASGDSGGLVPGTIGQADVDEAYRAEVIRKALLSCYRTYDTAQAKLSQVGINESNE